MVRSQGPTLNKMKANTFFYRSLRLKEMKTFCFISDAFLLKQKRFVLSQMFIYQDESILIYSKIFVNKTERLDLIQNCQ
jgi:hypothetical protein